jgi:hypothetical protein
MNTFKHCSEMLVVVSATFRKMSIGQCAFIIFFQFSVISIPQQHYKAHKLKKKKVSPFSNFGGGIFPTLFIRKI